MNTTNQYDRGSLSYLTWDEHGHPNVEPIVSYKGGPFDLPIEIQEAVCTYLGVPKDSRCSWGVQTTTLETSCLPGGFHRVVVNIALLIQSVGEPEKTFHIRSFWKVSKPIHDCSKHAG